MRIVSWNCNGALARKFPALAGLGADVYVVQECESPAASRSTDKAFDLREFFERYPRNLLSITLKHTSDTAQLNEYPADWSAISDRTRQQRHYQCEGCSIRLGGGDARYLHVHHRNGLKHDTRDENLEVLCIRCHANQPVRAHLKQLPEYVEFEARYPRPST